MEWSFERLGLAMQTLFAVKALGERRLQGCKEVTMTFSLGGIW